MCEGVSKQTPDLKILHPLPRFEIPGSATLERIGDINNLREREREREREGMSSEVSLACHTYCNTGRPFIIVISDDP